MATHISGETIVKFNEGQKLMMNRFIAFKASDDEVLKDHIRELEKQVERLQEENGKYLGELMKGGNYNQFNPYKG